VYEVKELTQDDIKEIIRNVGANNRYSERSILHKLQNMGITAEQLRGIDITAELKMAVGSDDFVGFRNGRTRNQGRDNGSSVESRGNSRILSEENGRNKEGVEIQELRISKSQKFNQKPTESRSYSIGGNMFTLPVEYFPFKELKAGDEIWLPNGPARLERKVAKDVWTVRYDGINIVFGPTTSSWEGNTVNGKVLKVIRDAGQEEQGELYGFTYNGEIYLDETKMSPNAAIHEYTHLWDNMLINAAPDSNLGKLWKRGKDLMRKTSLWRQIAEDENYGKKWTDKTEQERENLIASEVHSRLVGENGEKLLMDMAKEKGTEGIIGKLKQWITDVWKALGKTFGTWTQDELDKLTLDDFVHMTVKDFVEGVNPNNVKAETTQTATSK